MRVRGWWASIDLHGSIQNWPFPERILISGFRQTRCFTPPSFKHSQRATSHRLHADISLRNECAVSSGTFRCSCNSQSVKDQMTTRRRKTRRDFFLNVCDIKPYKLVYTDSNHIKPDFSLDVYWKKKIPGIYFQLKRTEWLTLLNVSKLNQPDLLYVSFIFVRPIEIKDSLRFVTEAKAAYQNELNRDKIWVILKSFFFRLINESRLESQTKGSLVLSA